MKIVKLFLFLFLFVTVNNILAQEVVSSGDLSVTVTRLDDGIELSSIKNGGMELMETESARTFFTANVSGELLESTDGWDSVSISNDGTNATIILTNPKDSLLSESLTITITIKTSDNKSDWDMTVTGLGANTLKNVTFPKINIIAKGNDFMFVPQFGGKLFDDPIAKGLNHISNYPKGWSSSMQYMAYYNADYGIYFGSHDAKASKKDLVAAKNLNNGLRIENVLYIPDNIIPGNDWEYPGEFCLELFTGDWYDAAMVYKKWVKNSADYWPEMTDKRVARQNEIGKIGVWAKFVDTSTDEYIRNLMYSFADSMGVPSGLHWYNWNNIIYENNYPEYFPERDNMDDLVADLQSERNILCVPFTNGRLYDIGLASYPSTGKPGAAKKISGAVYTSTIFGNSFANMCPTDRIYQDILIDAQNQLTNRIGAAGVYLDQVTADSPISCYDPSHGHTLGGGNYWRSGYRDMFSKIHKAIPEDRFVTTEGCCDYLADQVDGFMTDGWQTANMVPAFMAIYGGRVQLFSTGHDVSDYNDESFYCTYSQAFVNGIQPGSFDPSFILGSIANENALPFIKRLARVRYKLIDYLSFGEMLRPLEIDRSSIPNITSTWNSNGADFPVTISALQSSLWLNGNGDKAAVIIANASMTQTIDFTLNFDGSSRNMYGDLKVQFISAYDDGNIEIESNSFTQNVSLPPMTMGAYIIEPDSMNTAVEDVQNISRTYQLEQNYPNPFNPTTTINFTIPASANTSLIVYNSLGQKVATLVNSVLSAGSYRYKFNASGLSSGVYFYKLQSNNFVKINKMLLVK